MVKPKPSMVKKKPSMVKKKPLRGAIRKPRHLVKKLYVPSSLVKLTGLWKRPPTKREIFKLYARYSSLWWIIGHGQMLTNMILIPRGVYVVFLSKPGYLGSLNEIIENKEQFKPLWYNESVMRRFVLGDSSVAPAAPRFHTWNTRIYGPGDRMPEAYIELYDRNIGQNITEEYDAFAGVHRVGTSARYHHDEAMTVSSIIARHGPGIYFVAACRGSPNQQERELMNVFQRNYRTTGGAHVLSPAQNFTGFVREQLRANEVRTRKQLKRKPVIRVVPKA